MSTIATGRLLMKKLLPIGIAALSVLSASAARAEEAEAGHLVAAWTCGKHVDVELRKYATANYELTILGAFDVSPGYGVNLREHIKSRVYGCAAE